MDQEADIKITKARIALLKTQPFFGTLALRLQMIEDSTLKPPTMAVDGKNIYYHPQFVNDHTLDEVKFVLAHEVMHCVFEHITRVGARDPSGWNAAGDYVINPILVDAGMTMPTSGGLLNPAFAGMTADEVYKLLPQNPKGGHGGLDSLKPAPQDAAEMEELAQDWKTATIQAANAARGVGKLPASMQRFVDEITATKTDWRQRLRQFAIEIAKNDYSWTRLNRRYMSLGIYLPGLHSEHMGTLALVTDDSGSIGNDILQLFANEIASIRDAVMPERTIVLSCDARINHVDDLTMQDPFSMKCHGGGGTDFRPPFNWLEKNDIKPACLIYLTDLEGPFPAQAPDYPVLWCSINNKTAPWGETLKVEP